MKTIICILFFLWTAPLLMAQVSLDILIQGSQKNISTYISTFSKRDKKTQKVHKGQGSINLIRYEQYIVVVYQKGKAPFVVSMDTEKAPSQISLQAILENGTMSANEFRPLFHFVKKGSSYQKSKFDLDQVVNKEDFAIQMQLAHLEIKNFYEKEILPKDLDIQEIFASEETMKKSEHVIGQEIYLLSKKKKALALDIERRQNNGYASNSPDIELSEQLINIQKNRDFVVIEKKYFEISLQLIQREIEREEIKINRRLKQGQKPSIVELEKKRKRFEVIQKEAQIAELNYKNITADYREIKKLIELEKITDIQQKQLKELEINNIRLQQRRENTHQLIQIHNELAINTTDRDRYVELANAQKHITDHILIKLEIAKNTLLQLSIEDNNSGKLKHKIQAVQKDIVKKEALAYRAEMIYLEQLWHLRNKDDLDAKSIDDLYVKQSQLLPFVPRTKDEKLQKYLDRTTDDVEQQAQVFFEAQVEITEITDARGRVKKIKIKDHYYEIVIDPKGKKSYFKNGKPITGLTYRFETVEKYGAFLENYRIEEAKRKPFLDFFKRKTR